MTAPGQLSLDLECHPALGQEDFLVASCNEQAVAWLDRWSDWGAPGLVIHGPAGCDKTHLAHVWQARSLAVFFPRSHHKKVIPRNLSTVTSRPLSRMPTGSLGLRPGKGPCFISTIN